MVCPWYDLVQSNLNGDVSAERWRPVLLRGTHYMLQIDPHPAHEPDKKGEQV